MKGKRLIIGGLLVAVICLVGIMVWKPQKIVENTQVTPKQSEKLSSYFDKEYDYETVFKLTEGVKKTRVWGVITSHHLLAGELIAESLAGIDSREIETVIIISPDHFHRLAGKGVATATSGSNWDSPYGELKADREIIGELEKLKVGLEETIFKREHGVYTLIPFIKKALGDAKVVPLVLAGDNSREGAYELGRRIGKVLDKDRVVVIISSDFVHEANESQAEEIDRISIEAIASGKRENLDQVTSDCKLCLEWMFGYLEGANWQFSLVNNSNSYLISGQMPEKVTSYVTGYFQAKD